MSAEIVSTAGRPDTLTHVQPRRRSRHSAATRHAAAAVRDRVSGGTRQSHSPRIHHRVRVLRQHPSPAAIARPRGTGVHAITPNCTTGAGGRWRPRVLPMRAVHRLRGHRRGPPNHSPWWELRRLPMDSEVAESRGYLLTRQGTVHWPKPRSVALRPHASPSAGRRVASPLRPTGNTVSQLRVTVGAEWESWRRS